MRISLGEARNFFDDENYVSMTYIGPAVGSGMRHHIVFKDNDRYWRFEGIEDNCVFYPDVECEGRDKNMKNFVLCEEVFPHKITITVFKTKKQ